MIFLRSLLQLAVLLVQGSWRGVAPSPTDEGALRASHGDHGEPGHKEPHKDSYSTFASEFLESRHLSDDGEKGIQDRPFLNEEFSLLWPSWSSRQCLCVGLFLMEIRRRIYTSVVDT